MSRTEFRGKNVSPSRNPEKFQKSVKIKYPGLKNLKIKKLRTWKGSKYWYLRHYVVIFQKKCYFSVVFNFDINISSFLCQSARFGKLEILKTDPVYLFSASSWSFLATPVFNKEKKSRHMEDLKQCSGNFWPHILHLLPYFSYFSTKNDSERLKLFQNVIRKNFGEEFQKFQNFTP